MTVNEWQDFTHFKEGGQCIKRNKEKALFLNWKMEKAKNLAVKLENGPL